MTHRHRELQQKGVLSAKELLTSAKGRMVTTAGGVIARQHPGTALGFIVLSMEDETGIANVIIHPELYEQQRIIVTRGKFLSVTGLLQNQDGVVHLSATRLEQLNTTHS